MSPGDNGSRKRIFQGGDVFRKEVPPGHRMGYHQGGYTTRDRIPSRRLYHQREDSIRERMPLGLGCHWV